jgi:hypothetical protein
MGKQHYSTGGGILFCAWPVIKSGTGDAQSYIINSSPSAKISFGVISRLADEVGNISTAISHSSNPQTITIVTDRYDSTMIKVNNLYNSSMQSGNYIRGASGTSGGRPTKTYQDNLVVNPTNTEDIPIAEDMKLFVYINGPKIGAGNDINDYSAYSEREHIFGLANLATSSFDRTYQGDGNDNQITLVFEALSENIPFQISSMADLTMPTDWDALTAADNHSMSYLNTTTWAGIFGQLTVSDLLVPPKTGYRNITAGL